MRKRQAWFASRMRGGRAVQSRPIANPRSFEGSLLSRFALSDEAGFRPKLFTKPERFEKRLSIIRRYGLRVLLSDCVPRLGGGILSAGAAHPAPAPELQGS
jgi:hypothetical protein